MCPNTKRSLHKETIESYSQTATGILIITIGLIFAVLSFGCWGLATVNGANGTQSAGQTAIEEMSYVQSSFESEISEEQSSEVKVSEEQTPEDENSEMFISDFESLDVATGLGQSDVSIAQSCVVDGLDVEAGSICLVDGEFPSLLPVCITNDWLANKYVTVCVYGGYEPVDGTIILCQTKTGKGGVIDMTWGPAEDVGCPCGGVLYTATFSVSEPIVLDSNHMPMLCIDECEVQLDGPESLDKEVTGCVCVQWMGCDFTTCCCLPVMDVEAGMISLYDGYFPDELPVCITNDWLADKYVTLCVYGGYEPISGQITLSQEGVEAGVIDATWGPAVDVGCPCGGVLYTATFTVTEPIVLKSNHIPEFDIPGCSPACGPSDLGKFVTADISMLWCGCSEADQQFVIIPAHKSFVPESPNSR